MFGNIKSNTKKMEFMVLLLVCCLFIFAIFATPSAAQDSEMEAELEVRAEALDKREADIQARETSLAGLEAGLREKEDSLREREAKIKAGEDALSDLEADLKTREEALARRTAEFDLKEQARTEQEAAKEVEQAERAEREAQTRRARNLRAQRARASAALVREGDLLARDRRYAEALEKYEQAYRMSPSEDIKVRSDNARRFAEAVRQGL